MGVLPQGAPTSPMLSNLAVTSLDRNLSLISEKFGLRYSRYADDLTFSTTKKSFGRSSAIRLVGDVYEELIGHGLSPNRAKTSIVSPGARKMVLGLLVDGLHPRLTREFRSRLRMHMYYITHEKHGPSKHAKERDFASVEGLRQHLLGLIAFAGQIDPLFAAKCRADMLKAHWQA
jgi:RNA-directed DNA polymerase